MINTGLSGEFRAVLRDPDGSIVYDSGWGSNLITDLGLTLFGTGWSTYCYIGSGSATPSVSDTAMGNQLYAQSQRIGATQDAVTGPNYERRATRTYRYYAGQGTGTIAEVGMGSNPNSSGALFCRHLLTPAIVKSANQTLDVTYAFTKWPDLVDVTGTAVISGITYDWVASPYYVTTPVSDSTNFNPTAPTSLNQYYQSYSGARAGLTDTAPSGSALGGGDPSGTVYDSGFCEFDVHYGLTVGNGTDYLRTFLLQMLDTQMKTQVEFTQQAGQPNPGEGVPKDNTEEADMKFRFTWGRH